MSTNRAADLMLRSLSLGVARVERPGLEYQYAFDLCAVEVHRIGRPAVIFASSAFHAQELLKRLDGCEVGLVPAKNWGSSSASIGELMGPGVEYPAVQAFLHSKVQTKTLVWAGPESESGEQVLRLICRILRPGGHLYVIASGWLARFLPEWHENHDRPGDGPIGWRQTRKWLRQGGFTVEAVYGFHGPASVLWGYTSRLMERLGRGNLADRCRVKMRAEYLVRDRRAMWAPVGVVLARKR